MYEKVTQISTDPGWKTSILKNRSVSNNWNNVPSRFNKNYQVWLRWTKSSVSDRITYYKLNKGCAQSYFTAKNIIKLWIIYMISGMQEFCIYVHLDSLMIPLNEIWNVSITPFRYVYAEQNLNKFLDILSTFQRFLLLSLLTTLIFKHH